MVTGTGWSAASENMIPERSMRVAGPGTCRRLMFSMNRAATISIAPRNLLPVRSSDMGSPSWGRGVMVATSNPLAVEAALWALDEGGTAMDAALASDAVLGVVQPMSTGVGGDIFCLVDDGSEVVGFNGSGAAPSALTLEACRREGAWGDRSPLCVTVPGAVDGWSQLAARYGRLGLERTTLPARQLAAAGFPLGAAASATWRAEDKRMHSGSTLPRQPSAGQRV